MSEIQTTAVEAEKIRLLADNEMYSQAADLAAKQLAISKSQLAGLRQFSRSWGELGSFIRHQKKKREEKGSYLAFYSALAADLQRLESIAKTEFVPDNLSRKEARGRTVHFAGRLADAFIQHLAAEIEWQQKKGQP